MKDSLFYSALGLGLFLLNLASAYSYEPYFSDRISFGNILNSIEPSTMILGIIFIVAFALLFFALSRALKGEKVIAGIISFALSLFIVYGINKSGFDIESLFYKMGITLSVLNIIFPLFIILLVIIFIIATFKKSRKKLKELGKK